MALIWAKGFSEDRALAPVWRGYSLALARQNDASLSEAEQASAFLEARNALSQYNSLVAQADTELTDYAKNSGGLTHLLVIGVGKYDNPTIPALTTSVYGAQEFVTWMLTKFQHLERPLGSFEMVLSPAVSMGEWIPEPAAANALGLTPGDTLPLEAATFAFIKSAFDRWLVRSQQSKENAAFLYYSGHGLWKSSPLLLPQDTQIANARQSFQNLIDINQTLVNMFNTQPGVQCFFVDACQESTLATLQVVQQSLGQPLANATTGAFIADRDAWIYYGSRPGYKAYGPPDQAPFFTQELLQCLERRAAKELQDDATWNVTTQSLREGLEAAAFCRRENDLSASNIGFSYFTQNSTFTADLCHISGPPEVFVKIKCLPSMRTEEATLFVERNGTRTVRTKPLPPEWIVPVIKDDCVAGAQFDPDIGVSNVQQNFHPFPPVFPVQLPVK